MYAIRSYYVMEEHKETNTDNLDTYSKKISGTETIATMCLDIDGKNFFKAEPSILEEGKYIDVADDTKQALIELFAHREAKHGLKPDASIDELPNSVITSYSIHYTKLYDYTNNEFR